MNAGAGPVGSGPETEQELREELETLQARRRALDEPDEADSVGDVGDSAESLRRADERTRVEDRIALIERRLSSSTVHSDAEITDDDTGGEGFG